MATASATSILWFTGFLQSIDLQVFDLLLNQFPKTTLKNSPTVVVGITENDITDYGWPLDDIYLLKLFRKLDEAGVTVIGLDLYRNVGVGDGAEALANYSRNNPKVISIFNVAEEISSIPGLSKERQAFNDMPLDIDNVIRRNLVGVDIERFSLGAEYVSLPMRMIELHQKYKKQEFNLPKLFKTGQIPTLLPNSGGYKQLDASGYQLLIDYARPGTIPTYSLGMILRNEIRPKDLKGRMAIVGATAPSLKDEFAIPFSRFIQNSNNVLMSGAEIHAQRTNQLHTLQEGQPPAIRTLSPKWELAVVIIFAFGTALLIESSRHTLIGLAVVASGILFLTLGTLLAFSMGWWIEIALPGVTTLATASVGWVRKAAAQQRQKQLMQKLLGQSTSPAVAEELWNQKDSLLTDGRFTGRDLPVTILFSDTVGFSTVSEGMSPSELLNWLNLGMEKFVKIIISNGGMVNKFTGDGFLAVFGAPAEQPPQFSAKAAIETAIELQKQVKELQQKLQKDSLPPLRLRVGIHSGRIIAGSMGGAERIEYALIGDSVNVAARLESLEKEKMSNDCRILVSAETLSLIDTSSLILDAWGFCKVKGRDKPVHVSELRERN